MSVDLDALREGLISLIMSYDSHVVQEQAQQRAESFIIRFLAPTIAKAGRVEAAEKESERLRARQDAALRGAIRNWSARLHIPVTRMMSRALREEFAAALAATQPDSTEARHG